MQAMDESPILPRFLQRHIQKNNIGEQELKKKINLNVKSYTEQLEIQSENDPEFVTLTQSCEHTISFEDFNKSKKLYTMALRRHKIKPKEKIEPLILLCHVYKQQKNNNFITASFKLLKDYRSLEQAPPQTIKKAATLICLENIPEKSEEKEVSKMLAEIRHALQQELNKRSNIINTIENYPHKQLFEKELRALKDYAHTKMTTKNYDQNQAVYKKLLHTILDTLQEIPYTNNIQYAIEQRLTWYASYPNTITEN